MVNSTFAGDGYFRAALYKDQVFIEIMYNVNYNEHYRDRCRSYWFDQRGKTWININDRRLTPKSIMKHYALRLRQKRITEPL